VDNDILRTLLNKMMRNPSSESNNAANLGEQIGTTEPFHMFGKIGRINPDEFSLLQPHHQERYLEGLQQADSNAFEKVFGDWLNTYNPGRRGGGLTSEYIQNALTPYFDIMRTGKPRGE